MFTITLTPMREDRPRYARLVSYEVGSMTDCARMTAVRREYEWVQDPRGKWRWTCVRVSELRRPPGLKAREWPRKIDRDPPESEELRRARIMDVRRRIHVDPAIGSCEPDWNLALQLATVSSATAVVPMGAEGSGAQPLPPHAVEAVTPVDD